MAITYTWKIAALDTAPSENGLNNVVKTAHYTVDAVDGEHQVGAYGSVGFDTPDGTGFVSYANLTEEVIVGWVQEKLDVAEVETALANAIELKKNPPVVQHPLPWLA
jgi:hypothetical protein